VGGASRYNGRLTAIGITQRLHEILLNGIQEPMCEEVVLLEELVAAGSRQRQDYGTLAGAAVDRAGLFVEQAKVGTHGPGAGEP
jgi:hypothetical protein